MPLHVGMTVCAIAFCTCFSCFLYLARLFWNQTCGKSKRVARWLYRPAGNNFNVFNSSGKSCFDMSFCNAYTITSIWNFNPKTVLEYSFKDPIDIYRNSRCHNTKNHNETLIGIHERERTLGKLGVEIIFKLILEKMLKI